MTTRIMCRKCWSTFDSDHLGLLRDDKGERVKLCPVCGYGLSFRDLGQVNYRPESHELQHSNVREVEMDPDTHDVIFMRSQDGCDYWMLAEDKDGNPGMRFKVFGHNTAVLLCKDELKDMISFAEHHLKTIEDD